VIERSLADLDATLAAGRALGRVLVAGDVIALCGDLGAGKTSLVRGVALGAGVDEAVVASPTFALIHVYPGRVSLTHVDLYRIERAAELDELGLDELIDRGDSATLIEWADRFPQVLPVDHLRIELWHDGPGRRLVATATGPTSRDRLTAWRP
jgi:tRNA threonylcarbamoyladenosine biosynthesis protein TsaE